MVALTSLAVIIRPAQAETLSTYHFDSQSIQDGWTLKVDSGAELGIFKNVLTSAGDVSWVTSKNAPAPLPANMVQVGLVYHAYIASSTALDTKKHLIGVALPDTSSVWQHSIWAYDTTAKTWNKLSSKLNTKTGKLQAGFDVTDAYLTIFEDRSAQEGIASWYCKLHCSPRYPKLHGTSNDFPVGSYVTVTSLETGKSVKVKIISRWGQPKGRVVDLSWAAYSTLKTKNTGLTRVRVAPASNQPAVMVPAAVSSESLPNLHPTTTNVIPAPKVSATAYAVIDAGTGQVLATSNSTTVRPIASLTKLMTAMVFLDTKPNMDKIVTYTKADVTAYAYLRIKTGETLSLNDAFYSLLVGSANNAATLLARSTGMTRTAFLAAMNAKARSWGLTNTSFVDVSGLDPKNVSSAADMAVIANHAFHDYPLIRKATVAKSYTFATRNTKVSHTIKTTDKLLTSSAGLTITGGKTGFLDEAQYTYVLRTKNTQGAQIVVSLLGAPTSSQRFSDAAKLASWTWSSYQWL